MIISSLNLRTQWILSTSDTLLDSVHRNVALKLSKKRGLNSTEKTRLLDFITRSTEYYENKNFSGYI